jgi:hypothetical protein
LSSFGHTWNFGIYLDAVGETFPGADWSPGDRYWSPAGADSSPGDKF